jgi:hypothetical protein
LAAPHWDTKHCDMETRSCSAMLEDSSGLDTKSFGRRFEAGRLEEGKDLAFRSVDGMLSCQAIDRDMNEDVEGFLRLNERSS